MSGSSFRHNSPRLLVRCAECDRAFWLLAREAPLPDHSAWMRGVAAHRDTGARCPGSGQRGYWIGEGEGPVAGTEALSSG